MTESSPGWMWALTQGESRPELDRGLASQRIQGREELRPKLRTRLKGEKKGRNGCPFPTGEQTPWVWQE